MNSKKADSKDLMKNNSNYFHLFRRQKDVFIDDLQVMSAIKV